MKNKEELEKTIEKNRNEDFVLPMNWDIMFCKMFTSEEALPLLEHIISVFSNVDIEKVKGKVKVVSGKLRAGCDGDTSSKSYVIADYHRDKMNEEKYIFNISSASTIKMRNEFNARKALEVSGDGIVMIAHRCIKTYDTILVDFTSVALPKENLIDIAAFRDEDGKIMDNSLRIFEVNMSKAKDLSYKCANEQEEKLVLISRILTTRSLSELDKVSNELMGKEAAEKLVECAKRLSNTEKYAELFAEEEYYKKLSYKTDLDEKFKEGSKEKALEIAKNLLETTLTNEQISENTGVSTEEIDTLRKNIE